MTDLPLISIITPSFNQAQYLEQTIRSVLAQDYPHIEYIVIDGGSTDGSADLIRKYADRLAYWVSERDSGQAEAINKGFVHTTGSLVGWINSDDFLLPGAVSRLAAVHSEQPEAIVLGDVINFIDGDTAGWVTPQHNITLQNLVACWRSGWSWHQPGIYVPRRAWAQAHPMDESLRYTFDRDWLCKVLLTQPPLCYLGQPVAAFRLHDKSKTMGEGTHWTQEQVKVSQHYESVMTASERREMAAAFELMDAVLFVSLFYIGNWNRGAAARCLGRAARLNPGVVLGRNFWRTAFRLLWPLSLVRWVRSLWMRSRRRVAVPLW